MLAVLLVFVTVNTVMAEEVQETDQMVQQYGDNEDETQEDADTDLEEKVVQTSKAETAETEETVETDSKKTVSPEELDLGDYQTEMTVGSRQLLTVTILPFDAKQQDISYRSDNTDIADINGMGRITAKSIGTVQIYVSCGKITESFELTVTDKTEETEEIIPVTDIDISDYEKELEVTKTMTLSATVVPANASESMIRYMSSNPAVAAVNSTGEIRGIATGNVVIYCSAGNITKEVPVTVKVATQKLSVNKDYLIMKPGNTIELKTSVLPKEACQNITYQSVDTEVAEVSSNGVVTAKKSRQYLCDCFQ